MPGCFSTIEILRLSSQEPARLQLILQSGHATRTSSSKKIIERICLIPILFSINIYIYLQHTLLRKTDMEGAFALAFLVSALVTNVPT